jgi:hypothetical protein
MWGLITEITVIIEEALKRLEEDGEIEMQR